MSKEKKYNSLEAFAKEWKKENPTPKSEKKKVEKPKEDNRKDVIRIPI